MKNPFIESLRKALGEVINWDAVADKPTGDISYMEKVIDNIDFEAIQKNAQSNMNNSSNKSQKKMEHRKHSSEYLDGLIDSVYQNWKVIGESYHDDNSYDYNHHQVVKIWLVITLKNGYKFGDSMTGSIYQKYHMMNNLYYELKRKLMYTFDYIQYMMLHKGIFFISNSEFTKLREIKKTHDISIEIGEIFE